MRMLTWREKFPTRLERVFVLSQRNRDSLTHPCEAGPRAGLQNAN